LNWRAGALDTLTVRRLGGDPDRTVRVRYREHEAELTLNIGQRIRLGASLEATTDAEKATPPC
ncbi:MAG: hypothetical protein QOI83_1047, partial [Streptomycetaceae bacterium]|nr:hypothetical protein [Streptomycetaceae bacterium]